MHHLGILTKIGQIAALYKDNFVEYIWMVFMPSIYKIQLHFLDKNYADTYLPSIIRKNLLKRCAESLGPGPASGWC